MCGISGIVGLSEDKSAPLVQRMNDAMAHRGPDATHVFTTNEVSLGHRRLSIIDLSHGADQPFTDSSGRYSIVFNGEIYNYREIRAELRAEWRSESDTETILAAYMQWGKECLHKLRGMFAFAIWDAVEKSLFIARDRLGVKPFYYYKSNRVFAFASEIRALLSSNLCNAKIDKDGLYYYLKFGFVKSPRTILQNILQLNPGEYGIWKDGELTITTYWSLVKNTTETVKDTHQDIVKEVRELFRLSIKDRLVADVKVGAFLSGGIDSSGVVAMMSQLSDQAVETFSIVFNEKDFDESEYSKKIADLYQTKHTELLLKPEDILRNLPEFLNSIDTPGVDGINTFMVSKLVAATGIKVVLSGTGGDELFAGYNGFTRWKSYRRFARFLKLPLFRPLAAGICQMSSAKNFRKLTELLSYRDQGLKAFYESSRSIYSDLELKQLIDLPEQAATSIVELDSEIIRKYPALSQYSIAELSQYTMEVLLKDTDQMSMSHALEVREPFFDHRLIEYVLRVSDKDKFSEKTPKSLFVEAMKDLIPSEIIYRPKKGFTFPWNHWLRGELSEFCNTSIEALERRSILKAGQAKTLWEQFLKNSNKVSWLQIWLLVILENWLQRVLDDKH